MGATGTLREVRSSVVLAVLTMALGAWLFVSAFVLPHGSTTGFNDVVCGLVIVTFGACTLYAPAFRYFNTGTALYLGVSAALLFGTSPVGRANEALVAAAVFAISLAERPRPRVERAVS